MSKLFFLGHLGLGDVIVLNGMVNLLIEHHNLDEILVVNKRIYQDSVEFLYRNNPKVKHLFIDNDTTYADMTNTLKKEDYQYFPVGFYSNNFKIDKCWADDFYLNVGMHPLTRFVKFKLDRDLERENQLYQQVVEKLGSDKYIILHDDPERNFNIDTRILKSELPKFYLGYNNPNNTTGIQSSNIFDYCTLLEKAEEIHCIDSCFAILTNYLQTQQIPKYLHHYVRNADIEGLYSQQWFKIEKTA